MSKNGNRIGDYHESHEQQHTKFSYSNIVFDLETKTITLGETIITKDNFKQHLKGHDYQGLRILFAMLKTVGVDNDKIFWGSRLTQNNFLIKIRTMGKSFKRNFKLFNENYDYLSTKKKKKGQFTNTDLIKYIPYAKNLLEKFNIKLEISRQHANKQDNNKEMGYIVINKKHEEMKNKRLLSSILKTLQRYEYEVI